jgi:hypothetical protein
MLCRILATAGIDTFTQMCVYGTGCGLHKDIILP